MNRSELLEKQLEKRILIADGAMGTMVQTFGIGADDYGGERYEGCLELLSVTKPEVISSIHEQYLQAGADIIETNTFGAVSVVLSEYGLEDRARELNIASAKLAAGIAARYSTPDKPRFVAGAMGPTTRSLFVTGGISFDKLAAGYKEQALALIAGGADILILETAHDLLNIKAGLAGVEAAFVQTGSRLHLMVSVTLTGGKMLSGHGPEAVAVSLDCFRPLSLGFNCGAGTESMNRSLKILSGLCRSRISFMPNAGLPDENGKYRGTPADFALKMKRIASLGMLNIAGGCCGTTPEYIRALSEALKYEKPRRPVKSRQWALSGIEPLFHDSGNMPLLAGERTNSIGSRLFRETISSGKWEEAVETGKNQVKAGAHLLDVCLANPDRDELSDMREFVSRLIKAVRVPLMIDTTDLKVAEEAFKLCPGRCILNSVNLEHGEERLAQAARLVRRYGAAVVFGCIDENKTEAMALSRKRKLEMARRAFAIFTATHGLEPEDILFDPLVFPAASGDGRYAGTALETIAAVRDFKNNFPGTRTLLGLSNVSFGLPASGREVINSVFLHHCAAAGLDIAIVNPAGLLRYQRIPENERLMAEAVLSGKNAESAKIFADHYKSTCPKPERRGQKRKASFRERLHGAVLQGSVIGLEEIISGMLRDMPPLELIRGPLSHAMSDVGKLFAENRLIVTEVLRSAEVMKTAITLLEPLLGSSGTSSRGRPQGTGGLRHARGRMLLATVRGDVHDIGKNLVHIIFKSNGFEVIDLGVKVPAETIAAEAARHKPDFIGLSGLLVRSAEEMAVTAEKLKAAGIGVPLIAGGAALTEKFTLSRIAPAYGGSVYYAKDAMHGLDQALRHARQTPSAGTLRNGRTGDKKT
ncbi:MAG: homocysteine S-methyltransferase family protein [bacterium]